MKKTPGGKCTKKYSYIGLRYRNIFPFNEIIGNECKIANDITSNQILGGKIKKKKTKKRKSNKRKSNKRKSNKRKSN